MKITYKIIKVMHALVYHHNGFVVAHAHNLGTWRMDHYMPKCMSCHKDNWKGASCTYQCLHFQYLLPLSLQIVRF